MRRCQSLLSAPLALLLTLPNTAFAFQPDDELELDDTEIEDFSDEVEEPTEEIVDDTGEEETFVDDEGLEEEPVEEEEDPELAAMSDEERMANAKRLYGEGTTALERENYKVALAKFEEAYNRFAPHLHTFNFNIGQAAYFARDCVKAEAAFKRFLDLTDESNPSRVDAQEQLLTIERTNCAEKQRRREEKAKQAALDNARARAEQEREDAPNLRSQEDKREDRSTEEREAQKLKHPYAVAGAVVGGIGVLSLGGTIVSYALAKGAADDLAGLASPAGLTGFPEGDYSDEEIFRKDSSPKSGIPAMNTASVITLTAGSVLLATGIALIITDVVKTKKFKAARASRGTHFAVAPMVGRGQQGVAASLSF